MIAGYVDVYWSNQSIALVIAVLTAMNDQASRCNKSTAFRRYFELRITLETARFSGAAQDAFDVHLGAEADDVGGFVSWSQACSQAGSGVPVSGSVNTLARVSQTGSRSSV